MAVVDLVKWNGSPEEIVWRFPSQELSTFTQLIVNESQEAFLVRGGVYEGPFGAGRHTLSTENIPILRELMGLPFGGQSPFSAEVWFVNKIFNLDVKWGTPDPIQCLDPKFGLMIPVRAFGQYGIQISNSKKFLNKLVGTASFIDKKFISTYLNGQLIKIIKSTIGDLIINQGVSVLEAVTRLDSISTAAEKILNEAAEEYGISIPQFNVHSINMPDDDPAVVRLRDALAMKTEMQILNTNYQQMKSFDVLEAAAKNEGGAGALMGAGVGAGLGFGIGTQMGGLGAVAGNFNAQNPVAAPPAASMDDKITALKKLGELRDAGILTEEEFASEKKKILDGGN